MRPSVQRTESTVSSSSVNSFRRSSDLTRAINSSASTGLLRKSSAPASMPRTLSPLSLNPVIRTKRVRRGGIGGQGRKGHGVSADQHFDYTAILRISLVLREIPQELRGQKRGARFPVRNVPDRNM